jgi:hypothetical protein
VRCSDLRTPPGLQSQVDWGQARVPFRFLYASDSSSVRVGSTGASISEDVLFVSPTIYVVNELHPISSVFQLNLL